MTQREKDALFILVRYAMGIVKNIPDDEKENIKSVIPVLYKESKSHDIAQILASALFENNLISADNEYFEKFKKIQIDSFFREMRMTKDLEEICQAFEEAKIPFIPLKGSVLRDYYPERWMRTTSDIDVLVKKEDLKRALTLLMEEKGYSYLTKYSHDVSLVSRNKFHIEIHYDLIEDGLVNKSSDFLSNIWPNTELKPGYSYWHIMKEEFFYLYHMVHAAKHLLNGGCGIKAFIDLWVLDNKVPHDDQKRKHIIKKSDVSAFDQMCKELVKVWLEGESYKEEEIVWLEDFVIRGGVYGTPLNHMAMQQQKLGGKWGYTKKLFFPTYPYMCRHYPILEKHKWLTPAFYVVRWFHSIFSGNTNRVIKVLETNHSTPKEIDERMIKLLNKMELR